MAEETEQQTDPSYFLERFVDLSMFAEDTWTFEIVDARGAKGTYEVPQDLPFALGARFDVAYRGWARAQDRQIKAKHPASADKRIADYGAAFDAMLVVLSEILALRNPDRSSLDYLTNDLGHGTSAAIAAAITMRMDPANWLTKLGLLLEPDPKAPAEATPKVSSA